MTWRGNSFYKYLITFCLFMGACQCMHTMVHMWKSGDSTESCSCPPWCRSISISNSDHRVWHPALPPTEQLHQPPPHKETLHVCWWIASGHAGKHIQKRVAHGGHPEPGLGRYSPAQAQTLGRCQGTFQQQSFSLCWSIQRWVGLPLQGHRAWARRPAGTPHWAIPGLVGWVSSQTQLDYHVLWQGTMT